MLYDIQADFVYSGHFVGQNNTIYLLRQIKSIFMQMFLFTCPTDARCQTANVPAEFEISPQAW